MIHNEISWRRIFLSQCIMLRLAFGLEPIKMCHLSQ